jgi:2'-phosphotransferase
MPREVVLSKALSHLLRHSAEKENLKISKEGYVNVADLVREKSPYFLDPSLMKDIARDEKSEIFKGNVTRNHTSSLELR